MARFAQDPACARHVGVDLGLPVVGLDLRGQRVPAQPQVLHEAAGGLLPVGRRHRDRVRGEGAGRAVDLAEDLVGGDPALLAAQPVGEDRELLAERGGGGRLAVGAREHRHLRGVLRERGEVRDHALQRGQPHLLHGALDHQGVGEVVDVLAGAVDVHHLGQRLQRGAGQAALDVVLDRFDVVDGLALDLGVLGDALGAEVLGDGAQQGALVVCEGAQPGDDLLIEQVDHPLGLHHQAGAVQRRLGEVVDQRRDLPAVAAVERGQGDLRGDVREGVSHGKHSPRTGGVRVGPVLDADPPARRRAAWLRRPRSGRGPRVPLRARSRPRRSPRGCR